MELYQSILLGILQGITEFLPVSSSGHLFLGQYFFGISEPSLSFSIALHFGTLLAVFVVFFQDIMLMIKSCFKLFASLILRKNTKELLQNDVNFKMACLIIIGSVPTAIIGLLIEKYGKVLFSSLTIVSLMLFTTGIILWISKYFSKPKASIKEFSFKWAFIIGISQGIAAIPGISRSGTTVVTGLFLGIERELAARFSFLLSIPAILGATLLNIKDALETSDLNLNYATIYGTIAAFIIGYISLRILMRIVKGGRFYLFAPYCWILGLSAVIISLV
ncbi:MAG: undecaprenyl-diphosphate phosphatase [Alphaproteobacteria bacterium]